MWNWVNNCYHCWCGDFCLHLLTLSLRASWSWSAAQGVIVVSSILNEFTISQMTQSSTSNSLISTPLWRKQLARSLPSVPSISPVEFSLQSLQSMAQLRNLHSWKYWDKWEGSLSRDHGIQFACHADVLVSLFAATQAFYWNALLPYWSGHIILTYAMPCRHTDLVLPDQAFWDFWLLIVAPNQRGIKWKLPLLSSIVR